MNRLACPSDSIKILLLFVIKCGMLTPRRFYGGGISMCNSKYFLWRIYVHIFERAVK